jgi:hypothetical protein
MKNLITFNNFLTDKILEKMSELKINELELILSPKLIKILKEVNHKIAEDLIALHRESEPVYKKTFIDLGSQPDMVSFIQSNKVPELVEPEIVHGAYTREINKDTQEWIGGTFDYVPVKNNPYISDIYAITDLHDIQFKTKEHQVWNKFRSEISIGRFISQTFPNKYATNRKREELAKMSKPDDIESFVNMYVAIVDSHSKKFELVSGTDIQKWYKRENYFKEQGTLGNSCMRDSRKSNYLELYAKNPEKISMLILYPEDIRDKIIGRAIVWKLDVPEGRIYMDRIYTANDSDEFMFIEYAKKQGWLYKSSQSYGYDQNIIDTQNNNSASRLRMTVKLSYNDTEYYPYIDTLQFYNKKKGILTNDKAKYDSGGYWVMTSTDGGHS